ncbi:MAG: TetR/AcrR family transcriptional regulator C-terminal ligand-binding domain-containing protein, partial [Chloroflexi bacterium]|nr:TetR/AcrR family transcriptional regulator C-terminal ligand-binding domain-containing protein [Chloroflexota bacterium]
AAGLEVVNRAIARGEIHADADPELVLDGVYGPLYLRLLFGHAPLDEPSIRQLIDQLLNGITRHAPTPG